MRAGSGPRPRAAGTRGAAGRELRTDAVSGRTGKENYVNGANIAGFPKVADATVDQRIV